MKTVKQQLKEELRTAISERKRLLELRNRSDLSKNDKLALAFATNQPSLASSLMKGRSETDLRGLSTTFLDPNITTDVSTILNTQSNDYYLLNCSNSCFLDENFRTNNANSRNRIISNTGNGLSGLDFNYECDLNKFKYDNQINQNYKDKLKDQKSLDTYLNESLENRLKQTYFTNGITKTTNTYVNSPIKFLNLNSAFNNQYLKNMNSNRLETSLSNKLDFNLKETKIHDSNEHRSRIDRASTSLSYSLGSKNQRSYSTDKWNKKENQERFIRTTKFIDNSDPMQINFNRKKISSAVNHENYQPPISQDGKNIFV